MKLLTAIAILIAGIVLTITILTLIGSKSRSAEQTSESSKTIQEFIDQNQVYQLDKNKPESKFIMGEIHEISKLEGNLSINVYQ